jgi:hypothetical protein
LHKRCHHINKEDWLDSNSSKHGSRYRCAENNLQKEKVEIRTQLKLKKINGRLKNVLKDVSSKMEKYYLGSVSLLS